MRKLLLVAAGAVALAAPVAASAQGWGDDDQGGRGYYQDRGDFYQGDRYGDANRGGFNGFPQFREAERHIRSEIRDGQREGWLDQGQAGDFYRRLGWIRQREQRAFSEHGWRLSGWDQRQIQQSIDRLDRAIDNERDDNRGDYGGWRR